MTTKVGPFRTPGARLVGFMYGATRHCFISILFIEAVGLKAIY